MKKSLTLSLATMAAATLLSFGAQAETYQGVQTIDSQRTRAEVRAEAAATAHSDYNLYAEGYSRGSEAFTSTLSADTARQNARAAAQAHNQNLNAKSYYNDTIPAQYKW